MVGQLCAPRLLVADQHRHRAKDALRVGDPVVVAERLRGDVAVVAAPPYVRHESDQQVLADVTEPVGQPPVEGVNAPESSMP